MNRTPGAQPASTSAALRKVLPANLLTGVIGKATAELYIFEPTTLRVLEMSRGALTNLGYSLDEVREMTLLDLMPSLSSSDLQAQLDRLTDSSESEIRFEQVSRRHSGSTYAVSVHIQLVAAEERSVFLAEMNDRTERQSVDHQLRQAQKAGATAQLTAGVAHDFSNILHMIMASLELVLEKPDMEEERRVRRLESAFDAAQRGADLTRSLSGLARREPLGPRRVNVGNVVSEIQELLSSGIDESIEIVTALSGDESIATVDPAQLESALINLVVNAQGAMPSGGRVTITSENVHLNEADTNKHLGVAAGAYATLAVSDTGIGMPHAVREHAFEPFFTTKPVGEGTGLGLAMVRGFCEQSGGRAIITSEEGVGTTVTMYLPRTTDRLDTPT